MIFFSYKTHKRWSLFRIYNLQDGFWAFQYHFYFLYIFSIIAKYPLMSTYCSSFRKQANCWHKLAEMALPKFRLREPILMLTLESLWSYMTWSLPPPSLCFTMLQLNSPDSVSHTCNIVSPAVTCPVCLECWYPRPSHESLQLLPQVIQVSVQKGSFKSLATSLFSSYHLPLL